MRRFAGIWPPVKQTRNDGMNFFKWPGIWIGCRGNRPKPSGKPLQALWINHMLIMSDENYPGPGVSFGRVDQYLLPYWEYSLWPVE